MNSLIVADGDTKLPFHFLGSDLPATHDETHAYRVLEYTLERLAEFGFMVLPINMYLLKNEWSIECVNVGGGFTDLGLRLFEKYFVPSQNLVVGIRGAIPATAKDFFMLEE